MITIKRETEGRKIGLNLADLRDMVREADRIGIEQGEIRVRINRFGQPWRMEVSEVIEDE